MKTAFEQKQELSIVLPQQSYGQAQSDGLFRYLETFRIKDVVNISLLGQDKLKFNEELNNSQQEYSIIIIESSHWEDDSVLRDINLFCSLLNAFQLKYSISVSS